jgi:hypothetical protein
MAPAAKLFFIVIIAALLCTACSGIIKEDDYEIDQIKLAPSVALPLAYGSLSVQDLLNEQDSEFIKVYPDGLVYLEYNQTLVSRDVRDLITVDDKVLSPRIFTLAPSTLPAGPETQIGPALNETVDLNYTPQKFTKAILKSGNLNFIVTKTPGSLNIPFEIQISLPGFTKNGSPLLQRVSSTGTLNLQGYTANMVDNTFPMQLRLFKLPTTSATVIPAGASISIALSWVNMDYTYVEGFMGDQETTVISDEVDIEAFGSSLDKANVSFASTIINFIVVNEYGIPLQVNFSQLIARKNGSILPITINPSTPVTVTSPTVPGASAITTVNVVNAKQLLDFAPEEFAYGVSGRINSGLTSGVNFLTDTSKLKVNMHVEVPLFGHASGIILSDTIDIDLTDQDGSTLENAFLRANIVNEIPLDAHLQLYLLDNTNKVLDSLIAPTDSNIIKGSQVNAAGELQSPGLYNQEIALAKSKLDKVFQSDKIIVKATVSTSKGSTDTLPDVKFKTQYRMDIKFGLRATLKLTSEL